MCSLTDVQLHVSSPRLLFLSRLVHCMLTATVGPRSYCSCGAKSPLACELTEANEWVLSPSYWNNTKNYWHHGGKTFCWPTTSSLCRQSMHFRIPVFVVLHNKSIQIVSSYLFILYCYSQFSHKVLGCVFFVDMFLSRCVLRRLYSTSFKILIWRSTRITGIGTLIRLTRHVVSFSWACFHFKWCDPG